MKKSLKANKLRFLFLAFALLGAAQAQENWSFLPTSPLFEPLIADPREPNTAIIAYTNQSRYEGSVGTAFELVRYDALDQSHWGWGIFGAGYILLNEDGATFPMQASDWHAGMYLSESSGAFSHRFEFEHQSSHLGDALEGSQEPIIYNGENFNFTTSFKLSEDLRVYGGMGVWDDLFPEDNAFFASLGTEVYSAPLDFLGTRLQGYGTCHLKWKAQAGGVFNKTLQLGFQWKFRKEESRAIRLALVYFNGNSEYGQFYLQKDEHLGIGVYFDP